MPTRKNRLRRRLAALIPTVLMEHPFEIYLVVSCLFIGASVLVGIVTAPSLNMIIPAYAMIAWGISLTLGSITVAISLLKKHAGMLASGLQLLGGAMFVYGIALMISTGFASAGTSIVLFLLAGALALIRSLYFRRLVDIEMGARRLRGLL